MPIKKASHSGPLLTEFRERVLDFSRNEMHKKSLLVDGAYLLETTITALEYGVTRMTVDDHLVRMVKAGWLKEGDEWYQRFVKAIEEDKLAKYASPEVEEVDTTPLPENLPEATEELPEETVEEPLSSHLVTKFAVLKRTTTILQQSINQTDANAKIRYENLRRLIRETDSSADVLSLHDKVDQLTETIHSQFHTIDVLRAVTFSTLLLLLMLIGFVFILTQRFG